LNSIEKIKRKRIINSKEKGKAISAQLGPTPRARACAHPPPDRRAPPIDTNPRPRIPTPSLPLFGGTVLSASFPLMRAPRPLSVQRASPVSADRPFAHPLSLARGCCPSEPSPQPTFARRQVPGTPLSLPLPPLFFSVRAHRTSTVQLESCRRRPEASPRPCRRSKAPESSIKVTNLPLSIISSFLPLYVRNGSLELSCAATEPLRRGSPPSGASALVSCPRSRSPRHPEPT
jgi:hypothetical protein